jgi:hypothetical protein
MVAAMAATVSASNVVNLKSARPPATPRRRSMRTKLIASKIAIIATGGVLAASGVAAAATGVLPPAVQDAVSHAADTVGVNLPATTADAPSTDTTSTGGAHGHKAGTASSGAAAGATVTCAAATNHGQYVSSVAHAGGDVPTAAQSDCGKKPHAADGTEADETDAPEVEKPEAPEVDKPEAPETETDGGAQKHGTKAAKTHGSKHGHGGGTSGSGDSSGSGD